MKIIKLGLCSSDIKILIKKLLFGREESRHEQKVKKKLFLCSSQLLDIYYMKKCHDLGIRRN